MRVNSSLLFYFSGKVTKPANDYEDNTLIVNGIVLTYQAGICPGGISSLKHNYCF